MQPEDIINPVVAWALTGLVGWLLGHLFMIGRSERALKAAMQSVLRDRLYAMYFRCRKCGGATAEEREFFQTMHRQYADLGANGVMDDVTEKFMELPVRESGEM